MTEHSKYREEYIDFIIKESNKLGVFLEIKPTLDDYLNDEIEFGDLLDEMNDFRDIPSFHSFVKSRKIDDLLR